MVAHLAHTSSLNETCDVCAMHEKKLRYVRSVTPPHRNALSNANRTRSAAMAEELFWTVKAALGAKNVTVNGKTAGFKAGDILLADSGYVDFGFLFGLEVRRTFFVTRQRGPLKYEVKESREASGDVISDDRRDADPLWDSRTREEAQTLPRTGVFQGV